MAKVWVQKDRGTGPAGAGDAVLVPGGDTVQVGTVDDGGVAVWHEVDPSLLPNLPQAGDEPQQVDDVDLVRAVEGVLTAERERGG